METIRARALTSVRLMLLAGAVVCACASHPDFFDAPPVNRDGGTAYMGRFNDFAGGEPNNANGNDEDCGALDSQFAWQWNDLVCDNARLGYLCEQLQ